jgi:hypothetical protein
LLVTLSVSLTPALRAETLPEIHVSKDPGCGCCGDWVEYLKADGFAVSVTELDPEALATLKLAKGIPAEAVSCHTAEVAGYAIEGHVPAGDIRRLLAERPDALGLAVPGMPFGSPGMGPESRREAYDVLLLLRDRTTKVFTSYPAA